MVQRGFPRNVDLPNGAKDQVLGEMKRGRRGPEEGSKRRRDIK